MAVCRICGAENPEGARFCNGCAAPLATPAAQREQRKTVTAVFCDVVGSTALGESRDPEALRALLARYFERMKAIVERHGGTVEKFIGDAVMAVFGVPVLHEDDAVRAVRAAAEMRAALPELGLEARIGVDTGEVVTGTEERLATGDAVNVAARLQQAAAPGEILLGRKTWVLVRDAVTVEELAPLELKGKREPVAAFRLLGVGEAHERSHGSRFVGRARELGLLRQAWDRAVEGGRCELVTIVGEPGVGKSRLVAEFEAGLDLRVLRGRCLSYGEGITYFPVVEVVKQLDVLPDDPAAAAAISSLLGESDAVTSADEIAWAFRKLLEQAAPLAVLFDDIQWGEETFLDLVEQVALLSTSAPLLLVCVARGELSERRPRWPIALQLAPLPPTDVEELLPGTIPAGLRERIARASGGNPLFVTEMLAIAAGADAEVVVPPTLKALLAARLDQLESAERGVLERGAVEGELFHRGAVQALEPAGAQVTQRLTELVRKALIRPDRPMLPAEDGFRFCHLLIRDAAYDALPKATRAELHERFADWLDQHGGDLVERDEILGYHLQQAYRYRTELGDPDDQTRPLGERAGTRLTAAGLRASTRGDHHAGANLLERALSLGVGDPSERARLQVELGYNLREAGRGPDADLQLDEAHRTAVALGERGVAALALVYRFTNPSDPMFDQDEASLKEAVETFAELGDERGLAIAERRLGFSIGRFRGRWAEGITHIERAYAHAVAFGEPTLVIPTFATALVQGPTPVSEAIDRCEQLLLSTHSNRVTEATLKRFLAVLHAMAARSEEALELARESSLVLDELNQRTSSWIFRAYAARARELAGDSAGAEQELLARWSYFHEGGFQGIDVNAVDTAYRLATFYADRGRWDETERFAVAVRDTPLPAGRPTGQATSRLAVEARLEARHGRFDEAIGLAQRAVAAAEPSDNLDVKADIWHAFAEVQRTAGNTAEADAAVAEALELYNQKGNIAAAARLLVVVSGS